MLNKAIIMGRLTREPELRYASTNNAAVCKFTLAVNRKYSKEEKQADFIPVTTFGKTAEFCSKYFHKGRQVAIVGRIQTSSWDDSEGKRHFMTEVVADEAFFADSNKQDNQESQAGFYPPTDDDDELPF